MVAFSLPNRTWNPKTGSVDSLRMLRELYVAVTRARRRVVVLVKSGQMKSFFEEELGLETILPSVLLVEFEKEVSPEDWFEKGSNFFRDGKYKLAASCFNAANNFGWSNWAQGRLLGRNPEGKAFLRTSSTIFYEKNEYERALDVLLEITKLPPWEEIDSPVLDRSLKERPHYLPRPELMNFLLARGMWESVLLEDLTSRATAKLFNSYRSHHRVRALIENCAEEERLLIAESLPNHVGDYCMTSKNFLEATNLFLIGNDHTNAAVATSRFIKETLGSGKSLLPAAKLWLADADAKDRIPDKKNSNKSLALLLDLFGSPNLVSPDECVQVFGISAVLEAIRWNLEKHDSTTASTLSDLFLVHFNDNELLHTVMGEMNLRPNRLIETLSARSLLIEATRVSLDKNDFEFALRFSDRALASIELVEQNNQSILHLWRDNETGKQRLLEEPSTSKASLLLKMFLHPETTGRQHGEECMSSFGEDVVKRAASTTTDMRFTLSLYNKRFGQFQVGDKVIITGLQKRPDLNGKSGIITRNLSNAGRYGVVVEGYPNEVTVRPVNLLRQLEGNSSVSSGGSSMPSLAQRTTNRRNSSSSTSVSSHSSVPPLEDPRAGRVNESSSDDDSVPPLETRGDINRRVSSPGSDSSVSSHSSVPSLEDPRAGRVYSSSSDSDSDRPPPLSAFGNESTSSEDDFTSARPLRAPAAGVLPEFSGQDEDEDSDLSDIPPLALRRPDDDSDSSSSSSGPPSLSRPTYGSSSSDSSSEDEATPPPFSLGQGGRDGPPTQRPAGRTTGRGSRRTGGRGRRRN